ncbi:hypothetical protein IscW_ISCW010441 [Ixodes scapularis]|uniref:Calsyntenin C-terminal domain-containing protein n=1 Tax=Ixodes scapularis TaxID=6945 RepID=B7Q9R7_IXOSC|nr:hypothetical protein IscW_ISCW010441 [Ixodes scapularis]|eukprot:XP_002406309.1 hypothetical protein IscW_ISCW010441 [Ixodes scapularis]
MAFHFRGYLTGLSVLRGRTESPDVLSCLHRCKEWLDVPPADAQATGTVSSHSVEPKGAKVHAGKYVELLDGGASEALAKSSASHAVTIIIVVCVGFLVFMIVLGVIRIRAAHQHQQQRQGGGRHRTGDADDQEMAWDDSSLTITVNPMDVSALLHSLSP